MDMASFLFITLNTCIGSYGPCNPPRTLKLCAITHENDHRTRKRQLFGHTTQTCIRPYGWCKSPWNTKIWSITHGNDHKSKKDDIFIIPLKYVNCLGTLILWAITHAYGQKTRK